MILDKITSFEKYKNVIPRFDKIADYLERSDLENLADGKYEIDGDNVYLLIQEYETKNEKEKKWESHKKYIDIQIIINGVECMGHSMINHLCVSENYNDEKDIIFYEEPRKRSSMLVIRDKEFCVFYPEDGHKPGYYIDRPGNVKKAVIKVRLP